MTWHFDPHGETMDVWDHDGTLVAEDRPFSGGWSDPSGYPGKVLTVMAEQMDGTQPSAYNQQLIADAALGRIEEGTP